MHHHASCPFSHPLRKEEKRMEKVVTRRKWTTGLLIAGTVVLVVAFWSLIMSMLSLLGSRGRFDAAVPAAVQSTGKAAARRRGGGDCPADTARRSAGNALGADSAPLAAECAAHVAPARAAGQPCGSCSPDGVLRSKRAVSPSATCRRSCSRASALPRGSLPQRSSAGFAA